MSNRIPFPPDDPQSWQATIGTVAVDMRTCLVEVQNLKTSNRVDVVEAGGVDVASIRHKGRKPGTFSLVIRAWTPEGWTVSNDIVALAHRQPDEIAKSSSAAALAVHHPLLAARGITSMYVVDITGPEWAGQRSTVTLDCIQFVAEKARKKNVAKKVSVSAVPTEFDPLKAPPKPTKPTPPWKVPPKP